MNQLVNIFWTILCFIPVIGFWLNADLLILYIFIAISILSLLLPARLLQLSNRSKFYEKLGIKLIRKFVQNGEYINLLIRKFKPGHKTISNKTDATRYLKTVQMYDRYHFLCLIFFLLTTVYALIRAQYFLAVVTSFANIIYNICPILLQQYNHIRILNLTHKSTV
jgi:hypothetical protein